MKMVKNCSSKRNFGFSKGFTLVELLVVIAVISVLATIMVSVINPIPIQQKARDSQRVSDLSKVKVALENYFSDNRSYPTQAAWVVVDTGATVSTALEPGYINSLPTDPKQTGTLCSASGTWRRYAYKSDGNRYVLATNMETTYMSSSCPFTVAADVTLFCTCSFSGGTEYFTTAD